MKGNVTHSQAAALGGHTLSLPRSGRPATVVWSCAFPALARWTTGPIRLATLLVLCGSILTLAGCGGCTSKGKQANKSQQQDEQANQEEEEEKKKTPFEFEELRMEPGDSIDSDGFALTLIKPGHWTSSSQLMKANYDDFVGEIDARISDRNGRPLDIPHTSYHQFSSRPVALAKGRKKSIATTFLAPRFPGQPILHSALRARDSGTPAVENQSPLSYLPPYQYYFLVLSTEPNRYTYLKVLDSVKTPGSDDSFATQGTSTYLYYRVLLPNITKRVPLPENALTWTSIAYLLWDEVAADQLTLAQQAALLDWLHWGGQLIVSGPDSLDLLRGSFLDPYLPADAGETRKYAADDMATFSRRWGRRSESEKEIEPLPVTTPWSGIELAPRAEAVDIAGNNIILERNVGRGRIVVSAFHLHERDLVNWKGWDGVVNGCLLRRLPRRYGMLNGELSIDWDLKGQTRSHKLDSRLITRMRFLSRDAGTATNYEPPRSDPLDPSIDAVAQAIAATPSIGAWSDTNHAATAARKALREAAGVHVPDANFVVLCLAFYLFVLVPLNWVLFQALGRVEWAWVAAPLIAILGTVLVVHQARLDIGYARAHTEVAILELQGDYDRGHLTRYTALYTSLSTPHDLAFDNPTTLAAPFPTNDPGRQFNPFANQQVSSTVRFGQHDRVRLTGMQVASNSLQMVHSEQMFPLDGGVRLQKSSSNAKLVVNDLPWTMSSVCLIRRPADGQGDPEGCWIGDIRFGQSSVVRFSKIALSGDSIPYAAERRTEAERAVDAPLNLEPLFELALLETLRPGETRLVGRVDEVLPGVEISPSASQVTGAVLLVANLTSGSRRLPRPDVNSRLDFPSIEEESAERFNRYEAP